MQPSGFSSPPKQSVAFRDQISGIHLPLMLTDCGGDRYREVRSQLKVGWEQLLKLCHSNSWGRASRLIIQAKMIQDYFAMMGFSVIDLLLHKSWLVNNANKLRNFGCALRKSWQTKRQLDLAGFVFCFWSPSGSWFLRPQTPPFALFDIYNKLPTWFFVSVCSSTCVWHTCHWTNKVGFVVAGMVMKCRNSQDCLPTLDIFIGWNSQ